MSIQRETDDFGCCIDCNNTCRKLRSDSGGSGQKINEALSLMRCIIEHGEKFAFQSSNDSNSI